MFLFSWFDVSIFDVVVCKRSKKSKDEFCEKFEELGKSVDQVFYHGLRETFFVVFRIIAFGKLVYFAEGEKDNGMCKGY